MKRSMILTGALAVLLLVVTVVVGEDTVPDFVPGRLLIIADQSHVSWPRYVDGLIFDTSDCGDCRQLLPKWRFLGDLKVDSIVFVDTTALWTKPKQVVELTGESQMENITISNDLAEKLAQLDVFHLVREFRGAPIGETPFWDSVRQKWHVRNDMSIYYEIRFPDTISLEAAKSLMQSLLGSANAGRLPIPIVDGHSDSVHSIEPE